MTQRGLEVKGLVAGYVPGQPILRGLDLSAKPGRITVVLGANGAGKSTMLRTIAGYVMPEAGRVVLDGVDITRLPDFEHMRHSIAILPQGRSTFSDMTVEENIELGGWTIRSDKRAVRHAIEKVFVRYPMLKDIRKRPAGSLSGGQQRIVEIARILLPDPKMLLIDEPSVGLAPIVARQVYGELEAFRAEGRTVLLVDQDVRAAVGIADYVYVLNAGKNDIEGDRSSFQGDLGALVKRWLGVGGKSL